MSIQQRKETFADFAVSLPLFSLPQKLSKSSATEAEAKENNFSDGNKHLIASPSPFLTQNEAAVRGRKQFPSFVAAEEWNTLHNPPSFDAMPSLWNSSHSIYTSPNSHHPQAAQQQFALRPSHSSQSRPSAASKTSLRSFHGNEERLHGSTTFHHLPSSSYSYDLLGTHPSASSTNHTNALLRLPFASKDPYALLSNTCVSKTSSKKLSTHYSSLDGSADTAEAHSNYTLPRFAPFVSTASTTSAVATPTLSLQDNPSTAYTSSPSLPSLIKPSNHLVTPQKKQENLSETSTFCNVLDTAPKASILPIVSSNSDKGVKHPPARSICSNIVIDNRKRHGPIRIRYLDQLPITMKPLLHTIIVQWIPLSSESSRCAGSANSGSFLNAFSALHHLQMKWHLADGEKQSTSYYFQHEIPPECRLVVSFQVYRKFSLFEHYVTPLVTSEDIRGSLLQISKKDDSKDFTDDEISLSEESIYGHFVEEWDWHITPKITAPISLHQPGMTFNSIGLVALTVAIFFGIIFQSTAGKKTSAK